MNLICMVFSIRYNREEDNGYTEYAVDWNWNIRGQWAMSDKEGLGSRWYTTSGLDEKAYEAILQHFGLENYKSELPLEKIIMMSPNELGKIRREKEKLCRLTYKGIISDTIGEHVSVP